MSESKKILATSQIIGKFELNESHLNKILGNIYKQLFKQQTFIQQLATLTKQKVNMSSLHYLIDRTVINEGPCSDYLQHIVNQRIGLHNKLNTSNNQEPFHMEVEKFINKFTCLNMFIETICNDLETKEKKIELINSQLAKSVQIDSFNKELSDFKDQINRSLDLKLKLQNEDYDLKLKHQNDKITQLCTELSSNFTSLQIKQSDFQQLLNQKIGVDQLESYLKQTKSVLISEIKLSTDGSYSKLQSAYDNLKTNYEIINNNTQIKYETLFKEIQELNEYIQKKCIHSDHFNLNKTINDDKFKEQGLKIYDLYKKCEQITQIDLIQKNLQYLNKDHETVKNFAQQIQVSLGAEQKKIENLNYQLSLLDLKPERVLQLENGMQAIRQEAKSFKELFEKELQSSKNNFELFKQKVVKQIQIFNNSFMNEKLNKEDIIQLVEREVQNQSVIKNRIQQLIQQSLILPNGMNLQLFFTHIQTNVQAFAKKIENMEMNQFKPKPMTQIIKENTQSDDLSNKINDELMKRQVKMELQLSQLVEKIEELQVHQSIDQQTIDHQSLKNNENIHTTKKCLLCGVKDKEKQSETRVRSLATREKRRHHHESISIDMGDTNETKPIKSRGAWFSVRSSMGSIELNDKNKIK